MVKTLMILCCKARKQIVNFHQQFPKERRKITAIASYAKQNKEPTIFKYGFYPIITSLPSFFQNSENIIQNHIIFK